MYKKKDFTIFAYENKGKTFCFYTETTRVECSSKIDLTCYLPITEETLGVVHMLYPEIPVNNLAIALKKWEDQSLDYTDDGYFYSV